METPKMRTNYRKQLLAHHIPNLLNKMKDTIDLTESLDSLRACSRPKLVESNISFDLRCSVLHMRLTYTN